MNLQHEIIKNMEALSRLGWNEGQNEAWTFADVDCTATLGLTEGFPIGAVAWAFWQKIA